jgi:hypothetical protein
VFLHIHVVWRVAAPQTLPRVSLSLPLLPRKIIRLPVILRGGVELRHNAGVANYHILWTRLRNVQTKLVASLMVTGTTAFERSCTKTFR